MSILSSILLRSPLSSGLQVTVTQAPGGATSHAGELFYGWDFALSSGTMFGMDVLAMADGTVVFIEESVPDGGPVSGSYGDATTERDPSLGPAGALGNVVTLEHNIDGQIFYSTYMHLSQDSVPLQFGDSVLAGEVIGQVGNTGVRTGTHLHVNIGETLGSYTNSDGISFPSYQIAEGSGDGGALLGLIDFADSPNADGQLNDGDTFTSTAEINTDVPDATETTTGNGLRAFLDGAISLDVAAIQGGINADLVILNGIEVGQSTSLFDFLNADYPVLDTVAAIEFVEETGRVFAALSQSIDQVLSEAQSANPAAVSAFESSLNSIDATLTAEFQALEANFAENVPRLLNFYFGATLSTISAVWDTVERSFDSLGTLLSAAEGFVNTARTAWNSTSVFFTPNSGTDPASQFINSIEVLGKAGIGAIGTLVGGQELSDAERAAWTSSLNEFIDTASTLFDLPIVLNDAMNAGDVAAAVGGLREMAALNDFDFLSDLAQLDTAVATTSGFPLSDGLEAFGFVLDLLDVWTTMLEVEALKDAQALVTGPSAISFLETSTALKRSELVDIAADLFGRFDTFFTATPGATIVYNAALEVVNLWTDIMEADLVWDIDDTADYFVAASDASATAYSDVILAYETLLGAMGADWVKGLRIEVHASPEGGETYGSAFDDNVIGSEQNDIVYAGDGSDDVRARGGVDTIFAEAGDDIVYAGSGDDFVYGGAGEDYLKGEDDNDHLFGEGENDEIYGDGGNDTLYGGAGDDFLYGGADNDYLRGEGDNDTLYGEGGRDDLYGDGGNDTLHGGEGADTLFGGVGADTFVYDMGEVPTIPNPYYLDEIRDFNQGNTGSYDATEGDSIDVSAIVGAAYNGGTGEAFADLVRLSISPVNHRTLLEVDPDGTGTAYDWTPIAYLDEVSAGTAIDLILDPSGAVAGLPDETVAVLGEAGSWTISPVSRVTNEDAGTISFTVSRPNTDTAETIYISTTYNQGSNNNGDYTGWLNVPVTFPVGQDEYIVDINILNDNNNESIETFGLIIQSSPDQLASEYLAQSTFSIMDDDIESSNDIFTENSDLVWIDPIGGAEVFDGLGGNDTAVINLAGWSGGISTSGTGTRKFSSGTDSVSFTNVESYFVIAGSGNDYLVGGDGADGLFGGVGNDTLTGGLGADILEGGAGDDTFNVGVGDTIAGGIGTDTVNFSLSGETADLVVNLLTGEGAGGTWTGIEQARGTLGQGDDHLISGIQLKYINGQSGIDSLTLDYSGTLADGRTATSINFLNLYRSGFSESVFLSDGTSAVFDINSFEHFTITGTDGGDTINGSTSLSNTFYGGAGNDSLTGGDGADGLFGGVGNDYISGGDGNDSLFDGDGNDNLYGGNDNDYLSSTGDGDDHFDGGTGIDMISYANHANGVMIDLAANTVSGTGVGADTIANFEDAQGSDYGADTLFGSFGSNVLDGRFGDDFLNGSAGDDQLIGSSGNDILFGGEGWDVARYDYDDTNGGTQGIIAILSANAAIDTFGHTDTLSGIEEISGSVFDDVIIGDAGANALYGRAGADTLDGGAGNDQLYGGAGADLMFGREDDDTLWGGADGDTMVGGAGNDTLNGEGGVDMLFGGIGDDILYGASAGADNADTDFLLGDEGNDTLYGGGGSDVLLGGDDNDTLFGGDDVDSLNGGAGADVLVGGGVRIFCSVDLARTCFCSQPLQEGLI